MVTIGQLNADILLDCKGLRCPQPVLRLKRQVAKTKAGQTILVICTDELSVIDIPHFVASADFKLLEKHVVADQFHFLIEKG